MAKRNRTIITLWSAMSDRLTGEPVWQAGFCEGGACIEAASLGEEVMMRSTSDPDSTFRMSREEWVNFLAAAKGGRFDDL
jgi:hypothetical protein